VDQTVSVDIGSGSLHCYTARVEAGDCLFENAAHGSVISNDLLENIQSLNSIFFEIANDGDLYTFAG
jgi:hypothetical protein